MIRILAVAAVAVRVVFMFLTPIDSDEPQHLHVAWAWSEGLVQYRDVFDNHFPLLHLIFAPLMAVAPESSAIFLVMRFAMLPIALACSWFLYLLARPLIGERGAMVAAIVFSVLPPWLPKSVEFRNDTLWIFFWLLSLVLVTARKRPAYILAGIAAGLCLLTSVKAMPLFLAHALALASQRHAVAPRYVLRIAGGVAIPVIAVAIFMFANGALDEMFYGTLLFNASLPVHDTRRIAGVLAFAVIAPLMEWYAPLARLQGAWHACTTRHLLLFAMWYSVVLLCFWPLLTPRDFLPLVPLGALALAVTPVAPVILLLAATLASIWCARLWEKADFARHRFVDAAVRLTSPGEYVFDLKGNAVFRRRPVYYIYDAVGRALTNNGTIPDSAPEQIAARGCCVAIDDVSHIPARTRAFLNRHFVDAGDVRVCGTIPQDGAFTIAVPQTYAVIARDPSRIAIDGVPYRGPRLLRAGRHTISAPDDERVTVIWWRAAVAR